MDLLAWELRWPNAVWKCEFLLTSWYIYDDGRWSVSIKSSLRSRSEGPKFYGRHRLRTYFVEYCFKITKTDIRQMLLINEKTFQNCEIGFMKQILFGLLSLLKLFDNSFWPFGFCHCDNAVWSTIEIPTRIPSEGTAIYKALQQGGAKWKRDG